ncbi:MAG: hypothetical protein C9356_04935 [Oleiphilus sp.]|nr:MAG: hypothetical protein C9356_04935 [Oleiphilus sp.]
MTPTGRQTDTHDDHIMPSCIWLISDGRPGHQTQLEGLAQRLEHLSEAEIVWTRPDKLRFVSPDKPNAAQSAPAMMIAAGHSTHRALYYWSRRHNAFSVVLMKPSLPLRLFDAVICPAHDGLKSSERVLNTQGVINKVLPSPKPDKHSNRGCILLGGISKHYHWDDPGIVRQIREICTAMPETHWQVFDSPRTPSSTMQQLQATKLPNIRLCGYQSEQGRSIAQALQTSRYCWVTPDSVSMIYEALTASCTTALLELEPASGRPGRVVRGVQNLLAQRHVCSWAQWRQNKTIPSNTLRLWEADRAALWLLDRFNQHSKAKLKRRTRRQ